MRDILLILEQDAKASAERIADLTGRTKDEVEQIIAELEGSGVIRRYKAVIDWERFGEEKVFAFIDVSVTPQRGAGYDDIARRIYHHPEVHSLHLVSGGHDLRVVVEGSGIKQVSQFVSEKLAPLEHVTATNTHFLLKKYKDDDEIFSDFDTDTRLVVSP